MQGKIIVVIALLYCFIISYAQVPGISGNWSGVFRFHTGTDHTISYSFKTENSILTGTSRAMESINKLVDGKVKGDSLSFAIISDDGSRIEHSGKYFPAGDSISLNVVFMDANLHMTLKRDN